MKDLKIFAKNPDPKAVNQVYNLLNQDAFKEAKIRIMPDMHAGNGCVIGFTGNLGDKIIPNVVGVDIGCGMLTVKLGDIELDLEDIDNFIYNNIPSGFNVNDSIQYKWNKYSKMTIDIAKEERLERSIGSLGGGNHFIEIAKDNENNKYLIIHSGSRNLGQQVAKTYQKCAIKYRDNINKTGNGEKEKIIAQLKAEGKEHLIQEELGKMRKLTIPNELCYLESYQRDNYLNDMKLTQEYASLNREVMAVRILNHILKLNRNTKNKSLDAFINENKLNIEYFQTIHNYIDFNDNIVRKGSIRANNNELVLIPINMRDGSILAKGKGNPDWNNSAPHGAGRLMSRTEAKEQLSLKDFKNSMSDIFTTSVCKSTLDEAPMAYKPIEDILGFVDETVEVLDILKPIYNFKAKC